MNKEQLLTTTMPRAVVSISPPPQVVKIGAAGPNPPTSPLRRQDRSNKESGSYIFVIISQRRSERKDRFNSMFTSLVSKYGGNGGSGQVSKPTKEEFEASQRKVKSRETSKKAERK